MIPIELESIRNIRDLGGTQADGGRTIRPGCLIRAAHLGDATDADLEALRTGHRVCTVIDLRTEEELSQTAERIKLLDQEKQRWIEQFEKENQENAMGIFLTNHLSQDGL